MAVGVNVVMPDFGSGDDLDDSAQPGEIPAMATLIVRSRPKNAKPLKCTEGHPVEPRSHGFQWPPDPKQIVAWVTIVVFFAAWFTLHGPFFADHVAGVVCSCVFVVLGVTVLALKVYMSLSPNEDPSIHGPQLKGTQLYDYRSMPSTHQKCSYCRRFVLKESRHCAVCDKCVGPGFDHHCGYLNTCISARNYKPFVGFLIATLLTIAFQWSVTLYLVVELARGGERDDHFRRRLITLYGEKHASFAAYVTFLVILWAYETLALVGIVHLSSFHLWLRLNGLTTVKHIHKKRAEKKARLDAEKSGRPPPPASPMCPCLEPTKKRDFKKEAAERAEHEKQRQAQGKGANAPY